MNNLTLFVFLLVFGTTRAGANEQLKILERYVEEGQYEKGLQFADQLLKSNAKIDRYGVLQIKAKIHQYSENIEDYLHTVKSAYGIKKHSSPVFKAYFFAQKAYYFHYHMISDSANYYAERSFYLLKTNWKDRRKIPFYFIYQTYGTNYLYNNYFANKSPDFLSYRRNILNNIKSYYDSALTYIQECKHFPQDKAIIFRSIGNRSMDIVGYTIKQSPAELEYPVIQLKLAQQATEAYQRALKCLNKQEKGIYYGLVSLQALSYYCTGYTAHGDALTWPLIRSVSPASIKRLTSDNIELLHVFHYFSQSVISKNKYDPRIEPVIRFYEYIRPKWHLYQLSRTKNYKDSYGFSPTTMLSLIYTWKKRCLSPATKTEIASLYPLDSYVYYSTKIHSLRNELRKSTNSPERFKEQTLEERYADTVIKLLNISPLQNKLRQKEAVLLQIKTSMNQVNFVLVTRQKLYIDTFKRYGYIKLPEFYENDPGRFKRKAYTYFSQTPFAGILKNGCISKLYVSVEIDENYDFMVTDTVGKSFDALHLLKKKINIVRIYNPIDFFYGSQQGNDKIVQHISPYLVSKKSRGRLPYAEDIFKGAYIPEFTSLSTLPAGVVHFIGHDSLVHIPHLNMFLNKLQTQLRQQNNTSSKTIKPELVVLNVCFGSFIRTIFHPDRDLHNYFISRGAKAVIASPYKTVDQSSAYIFEKFYTYLDRGISAEDALQKAKLDFLKTHKGSLAHPMYWSTYELTTNVKDLRMAPKSKPFPIVWVPMLAIILGVSGYFWWSVRSRRTTV